MRPYPEYKDSGVEWLGDVPAQWEVSSIFAVASERSDSNRGMVESNLLSLSYGRIIRKDIEGLDGLLPESFETYQVVQPDDIVMRLTDLQNDKRSLRSAIVKETGIITSAYLALKPVKIAAKYFAHLLRAYDLQKVFYSMGGGLRQSMKFSDVKRLPIILPSLPEQRKITAFLDREVAKIDDLIEEQRSLIALLAEKRQATISHAVTKGLNPNAKFKPTGIDWLGDVPEGWNVRRFKEVCIEIVDCKNRTPDPVDESEFFVVRTSCVRDGKFDPEGGYFTDEASFAEWTRKGLPQAGDILFTREAPAGEACAAPEDLKFCLGQRMMYLRPDPTLILSVYLLHSIYGPLVKEVVEGSARGSTVSHLRVGEIGELRCVCPPMEEQIKVIAFLTDRLRVFSDLTDEANSAITLLQEHRSTLISAAVTGKIDVRDLAPDMMEPA